MTRRSQPERLLEASYPFVHEIRSQFRDMDPLGHVNNVVLAAYYEDARAHFLVTRWGGGRRRPGVPYVVVVNVDVDYLAEALHPRTYRIGVGVQRVGDSSARISQALFLDGTCIGLADSTVVNMIDGRATPWDDHRRAALTGAFAAFAGPVAVSPETGSQAPAPGDGRSAQRV